MSTRQSIGFILSIIGTLFIIYYLMNMKTTSQSINPTQKGQSTNINNDLKNLKKSLDKQAKDEEAKMRREIEKQTGGN